jgi:TPR repeat protein
MNRAASEALEASIARRLASRKTDGWTAAEQGDAEAQYRVANLYLDESGDASNSVRAIELFEKAAAQGHLYAAGRVP